MGLLQLAVVGCLCYPRVGVWKQEAVDFRLFVLCQPQKKVSQAHGWLNLGLLKVGEQAQQVSWLAVV